MRLDYLEPESIDEALAMLSLRQRKAKVLAGGTGVMLQFQTHRIP
jgi:CO/xanthine dehydrogenase FAD-binding subunit